MCVQRDKIIAVTKMHIILILLKQKNELALGFNITSRLSLISFKFNTMCM